MNVRIPLNPWSLAFTLAILAQLGIVLAIPIPKAITIATGTTIYLDTRPVDPYDLLRGRYVTLDYSVESPDVLQVLPGYLAPEELEETYGSLPERVYLVMQAGESQADEDQAIVAWQPIRVAYSRPEDLEPGQQLLAGQLEYGWQGLGVDTGLGSYFIPETMGDALEDDIRQHQEATIAEIKVDSRGNSALIGVWVEDRQY